MSLHSSGFEDHHDQNFFMTPSTHRTTNLSGTITSSNAFVPTRSAFSFEDVQDNSPVDWNMPRPLPGLQNTNTLGLNQYTNQLQQKIQFLTHRNTVLMTENNLLRTINERLVNSIPASSMPQGAGVGVLPTYTEADFPEIRYWHKVSYKQARKKKNQETIAGKVVRKRVNPEFDTSQAAEKQDNEDGENENSEDIKPVRGSAWAAKGINVRMTWIERRDGTIVDGHYATAVRKVGYALLFDFDLQGIAPTQWQHASLEVKTRWDTEMIRQFPELGYCANNWKSQAVASYIFLGWNKRHGSDSKAKKVVKVEENNIKIEKFVDTSTSLEKRATEVDTVKDREGEHIAKRVKMSGVNSMIRSRLKNINFVHTLARCATPVNPTILTSKTPTQKSQVVLHTRSSPDVTPEDSAMEFGGILESCTGGTTVSEDLNDTDINNGAEHFGSESVALTLGDSTIPSTPVSTEALVSAFAGPSTSSVSPTPFMTGTSPATSTTSATLTSSTVLLPSIDISPLEPIASSSILRTPVPLTEKKKKKSSWKPKMSTTDRGLCAFEWHQKTGGTAIEFDVYWKSIKNTEVGREWTKRAQAAAEARAAAAAP
ncbi:hypothetical protein GG344DRAFT_76383 [Lentinula edodes]|nr:hypothetical protein GG344DRAFT_76383 [Lentinula edodes]